VDRARTSSSGRKYKARTSTATFSRATSGSPPT
jgi:hypothetical protein